VITADASWLIALLDPHDAHHQRAVEVRDAIGDEPVILHPLTLAECLVGPATVGTLEAVEQVVRAEVQVVDFDPQSPARFARLRAEHRLRLPDAVVLDTAREHQADIATFDDRLARAGLTEGLRVLGARGTDGAMS